MSEGATQAQLPLDVVEHMLDQLRGDAHTLTVCCRVCRDWYPRARYNLFYVVDLDAENSADFFAAAARDPEVATFIRELSLYGLWREPMTPPTFLRTDNLRTLRLYFIDTQNFWLPTVMYATTRSLTELSLDNCSAPHVAALVRFLAGLPALKHFAASDMLLHTRSEETAFEVHAFPALQSLCLTGFSGVPLRLVHACSALGERLQSLLLLKIMLSTAELAAFRPILASFGENLRELNLTVEPDDTEIEDGKSPLSLRSCGNLASLTLKVHLCHPKPTHQAMHLSWVPSFLNTLRAESLRELKVVVFATRATPADLGNLDWCAVARVLRQPRFATLRRVVVKIVRGGGIERSAVPYITERLAVVEKRGILRCVQTNV